MEETEEKLCSSCKINEAQELHVCPFKEEINDDTETLCDCCEDCTQNCRDDI